MFKIPLPPFLLSLAVLAGACSPGAGPSNSPDGQQSPTPSVLKIDHKTGAKDLILRYNVGGGFVPLGFLFTEKPKFSLYGDGTVIFEETVPFTDPVDSIVRNPRWKIAHLAEEQVQQLLEFAIGPGGLGLARANYEHGGVADAPSTIFELHAGGLDKTVSVYALGFDDQQNPDFLARRALQSLADRLSAFDDPVLGAVVYEPARYRATIQKADGPLGPGEPKDWPWTTIKPSDFVSPADPNVPDFPVRVLTADDVAQIGLDGIEGGTTGVHLRGPEGSDLYILSLRPLLPEEPS